MMKTVLLVATAIACVASGASAMRELQASSSSITCASVSAAKAVAFSYDTLEVAVVKAVDFACDFKPPVYLAKDLESGFAGAFARAAAAAASACKSDGNSVGCASAYAGAAAWAEAKGVAFAKAWAVAINNCWLCRKYYKSDVDYSGLLVKLFADAKAVAKTKACVAGNSFAAAEAFADCYGKAIAQVFAAAIAQAIAPLTCDNSKLVANAKAVTGAKYLEETGCKGGTKTFVKNNGFAGAFADGEANADTDFESFFD